MEAKLELEILKTKVKDFINTMENYTNSLTEDRPSKPILTALVTSEKFIDIKKLIN